MSGTGTDLNTFFKLVDDSGISTKSLIARLLRATVIIRALAMAAPTSALTTAASINATGLHSFALALTSRKHIKDTQAYWAGSKKTGHSKRDAALKQLPIALSAAAFGTSTAANGQLAASIIDNSIDAVTPGVLGANGFIISAMAFVQMTNSTLKAEKARKKCKPLALAADRMEKYNIMAERLFEAQASGDEEAVDVVTTEMNRMANQAASLFAYAQKDEMQEKHHGSKAAFERDFAGLNMNPEDIHLKGYEDTTPLKSDRLAESLLAKQAREHMRHAKDAVSWGLIFGGGACLGTAALVMGGCPPLGAILATTGISMVGTALAINMIDLKNDYGSAYLSGRYRTKRRKAFEAAFEFYTEELKDHVIEPGELDDGKPMTVADCIDFINHRQNMLDNFKDIEQEDSNKIEALEAERAKIKEALADKVFALKNELKTATKSQKKMSVIPMSDKAVRTIKEIQADLDKANLELSVANKSGSKNLVLPEGIIINKSLIAINKEIQQAKKDASNRKSSIQNEMLFARNKLIQFVEKHVIEKVIYHDEPVKAKEILSSSHMREDVSIFFNKHYKDGVFTPPRATAGRAAWAVTSSDPCTPFLSHHTHDADRKPSPDSEMPSPGAK